MGSVVGGGFSPFGSGALQEVLFMYFMNLVTLWAGWQRASQEIAEAALTCTALARLVPAACRGSRCLLPAGVSQSHSGESVPPASIPAGSGGRRVRNCIAFPQLCTGKVQSYPEGFVGCVLVFQTGREAGFGPRNQGLNPLAFFKRLPSKWWLLLT